MHTKYAHSVRGRPTLKNVERFQSGSVREPYERSLYEQTFMSEHFIEKHQLSYLMLIKSSTNANLIVYADVIVNQAEYQYEDCKVQGTSRKVREFVYARILLCVPISSTLYCYVNG